MSILLHENIDTFDASTMGGTFGHLTALNGEAYRIQGYISPKDIKAIQIPFEDDDYVLYAIYGRENLLLRRVFMWTIM